MDFMIWAVIVLGAIALVASVVLYVCAKKFAVEEDPRIGQVLEALPGANCGGCGFPGCSGMAGNAGKSNLGFKGVKTLRFYLTTAATVNSVGLFGVYKVKGNIVHSVTSFFVWTKADFNFAVFSSGICFKKRQSFHNFGHSSLVVCP